MILFFEIIKFIIFSFFIVLVSKKLLVPILSNISHILQLSPKAKGNITGIATSIPELLTSTISASIGFLDSSVYNIISSNIINFIQYLFAIYLNKNQKYINNKALIIDLVLVIFTIIIPIFIIVKKIELNILIIFIFIILLFLFYYINNNAHKLYLNLEEREILRNELKEENIKYKFKKRNKKELLRNYIYLIIVVIILYLLGEFLSRSIKLLGKTFKISEVILGILLGFITSIPELITFIESQKINKIKNKDDNISKFNFRMEENIRKIGVIEATNNLLTSNILNLFVIQTIAIIIYYFLGK